MIKVTDIYAATHDGLDIILYYYPQAEGCVNVGNFNHIADDLIRYKGNRCKRSYQGRYMYVFKPLHNTSAISILIP